ncbi:glycosyltransferase [Candidatus Bathyarchaeota archaeon]|nr:glycosyltransferase [Candidatus Bathyarchaeota archaeon]
MRIVDPFVVACVPAFNEEASIARVVLMAERYVDRVVICDDGSVDLTGVIAEGLRAVECGISGTLTEIMNG